MSKFMGNMLMLCTFEIVAKMLRTPEKFSMEEREMTAGSLDRFIGVLKTELTGQLMSDAIRDVPDAKS